MSFDEPSGGISDAAASDGGRVEVRSLDFTFRALDDDGVLVRYDALFSFVDTEDGSCYLVYCDEEPDSADEVGTYASLVCDPSQIDRAQMQVEGGSVPKKPPVVDLAVIEDDQGWELVEHAVELVDSEDD